MDVWTRVPKPAESSVTTVIETGGEPIGLLLALTYTTTSVISSITSGWVDVLKPTSSVWTIIPKSTDSSWTPVTKPTT